MFYLSASMCSQHSLCFQVEDISEKETQLWHRQFSHLYFRGLNTLAQKQMVIGLPSLKTSTVVCTTCLVGKQHRESIPKLSSWRASSKLQLVHTDVCGPISLASNNHKRYILSFVDDYSRKTWFIFCMRNLKPSKHSRILKHVLKRKLELILFV